MSGEAGILLRGGIVHDPAAGTAERRDLRIADGVLSSSGPMPGDRVLDVDGLLVAPGLVDLHAHVFSGQDLGVDADAAAWESGTTTLVDAGSAGAHLIGAFRRSTIERSAVRIRAFLNIATIGATSIMLGGELRSPWYVSEQAAVDAVEAHRDLVVGIKVRASGNVGGEHTAAALAAARRVADRVGLPLMVHLGPPPVSVDEIADILRGGDILTHAFTGWGDNRVVDERGRMRASVRAARERGVLLDVGHGMSGFSLEVAARMRDEGAWPDTISTDLHAYSRADVVDLPTVMSKFLALGMPVGEALRRTTVAPAAAVGLDSGSLRPGASADVAVLERVAGPVVFDDAFGGTVPGTEVLRPVLTIADGRVVFDGRRM